MSTAGLEPTAFHVALLSAVTDKDKEKGAEAAAKFKAIVNSVMLRRNSDVNAKYAAVALVNTALTLRPSNRDVTLGLGTAAPLARLRRRAPLERHDSLRTRLAEGRPWAPSNPRK